MIVAGRDVLGAKINKRDQIDPGDLPDTAFAAFGHSVGRAVALGYVEIAAGSTVEAVLAEGGLALDIAGEAFTATASLEPAWDPEGRRLRQ